MKTAKAVIIVLLGMYMTLHVSFAQDVAKMKILLYEVQLSPTQLDKIIDAVKAENAYYMEKKFPYMNVTQYSNDGYLWYGIPFTSYADLDKMDVAIKNLWKDNPEKMEQLGQGFNNYQNVARIILELQPQYSVPGESQMAPPEGTRFRMYEKFYIKPGQRQEFEKQLKKYVDLRNKHGITDAFYTYFPQFAPNIDVIYFVDETGNNPAEHYQLNDDQWQKFGTEGQQLWDDVSKLIDRVESHLGQIDYSIMYSPENE